MSDGLNPARSVRIAEIVEDIRTSHQQSQYLLNQPGSKPGDVAYAELPGYALLRLCEKEHLAMGEIGYHWGSY